MCSVFQALKSNCSRRLFTQSRSGIIMWINYSSIVIGLKTCFDIYNYRSSGNCEYRALFLVNSAIKSSGPPQTQSPLCEGGLACCGRRPLKYRRIGTPGAACRAMGPRPEQDNGEKMCMLSYSPFKYHTRAQETPSTWILI